MSSKVTTRFLIISDTHNLQFADVDQCGGEFTQPVPEADVILHCGDITGQGGPNAYKSFLRLMGSMQAELKLVIAGNHDLDLDSEFWTTKCPADADEDVKNQHTKAKGVMTGPMAKHAGVTYLEEGMHTFTLSNGTTFSIYASPYTPAFCGWAFPYERNKDRFNPPEQVHPGVNSTVQNPVPNFPEVDIMMTHGPPKGILDWVHRRDGERVGCAALRIAASRARPRLYCFGHIHEAYGCNVVKWEEGKIGREAVGTVEDVKNVYPEPLKRKIECGRETMMVNAAIMNLDYRPRNAPWLVELDLRKGD